MNSMADVVLLDCKHNLSYQIQNVTPHKVVFCFQPRAFFATLTFDFTRTFCESMVDEDDSFWFPLSNSHARVDFEFQHPSEIAYGERAIRQKLSSWNLTEQHLDDLVKYTIYETEKYTKYYARSGFNVVKLDFKFGLEHHHVVRYNDLVMDQILRLSFEESVLDMVPASEDSIKSLKRKRKIDGPINKSSKRTKSRVDGICDENCVICLEELSEGCDAVSMPCKHEFHGRCIEEWLNVSHYCPICRYEMPTKPT